jgi:hypothetical protein
MKNCKNVRGGRSAYSNHKFGGSIGGDASNYRDC